jgi:hypothetical protein
MGQSCWLQAWVEVELPQATPSNLGAVTTLLERLWYPVPQVLLQAPKLPKFDRTQLTGQGSELQDPRWESAGHATPWCFVSTSTLLVRRRAPVPHEYEHADQAPQPETWQWMGHSTTLQDWCWIVAGQPTPPRAGAMTMVRWRLWWPVPQVVEQVAQADQADTTQLIGQWLGLQVLVSMREGHTLPPNWTLTSRGRVREV